MKAKMSDVGKVRVVALEGKIGWGSGCEELPDLMKRLLAEGHGRIVLDLKGVSLMDSGGVGAMATCKHRAMEKNAEVVLVLPETSRIPLVVRTCLHLMYKSFENEKLAIASFAG